MRISDWSSDVCSSDLCCSYLIPKCCHVQDWVPRMGSDTLSRSTGTVFSLRWRDSRKNPEHSHSRGLYQVCSGFFLAQRASASQNPYVNNSESSHELHSLF